MTLRFWTSPLDLDDPTLAPFDEDPALLGDLETFISDLENQMDTMDESDAALTNRPITIHGVTLSDKEEVGWVSALLINTALEYNATCLHVFRDVVASTARFQLHMPVSRRYHQRPWNLLPEPNSDDVCDERYAPFLCIPSGGRRGRGESRLTGHIEYPYPPAPQSSRTWAWVEMMPLGPFTPEFHEWLNAICKRSSDDNLWRLAIRRNGEYFIVMVDASRAEVGDFRLYFSDERPTIRPKTPAQHAEVELDGGCE